MGRSEGSSATGAIAVIVIGGVLVLLLLGCVGLGAMSFLFVARSSPMPTAVQAAPQRIDSAPANEAVTNLTLSRRVITNNTEGLAEIEDQVYSDDALRELLANGGEGEQPPIVLELTADLAADRRAAIEQIVADSTGAAIRPPVNPNPLEVVPSE